MTSRRLLLTLVLIRLTYLQEIGTFYTPSSIITMKNSGNITCLLKCNASGERIVTEYRVSLRRGTGKSLEVCSGSFNLSYKPFNQSSESFNCLGIPSATNVNFHLWNLKAEHTDIYFCCTEYMDPPPYCDCNPEDEGTIIHVKEDLSCEAPPTSTWIMEALVVALAVYALLVSLALLYCWQRRGKETNSNKANTQTPRDEATKNNIRRM